MCYGEIVSASIVTARKANECPICSAPIPRGSRYHRFVVRGYDEGLLTNGKECLRCTGRLGLVPMDDACHGVDDGQTAELARERAKEIGWRAARKAVQGAFKRLGLSRRPAR